VASGRDGLTGIVGGVVCVECCGDYVWGYRFRDKIALGLRGLLLCNFSSCPLSMFIFASLFRATLVFFFMFLFLFFFFCCLWVWVNRWCR